jgi:hypothetical protein
LLDAELGDVEPLDLDLRGFLREAIAHPRETLATEPLLKFQKEGNELAPSFVISEYPFFCTSESADGVSLAAVPSLERRQFLADLYRAIKDTRRIKVVVVE